MIILSHRTGRRNAIFHYRQEIPLHEMHSAFNEQIYIDDMHPATTPGKRLHAFSHSDFVHCSASTAVQLYPRFDKVNAAIPRYIGGELLVPPGLIIDFDDRYSRISHLNPAFSFWGTRRPDGTPLEEGDQITVDTKDIGEMVLWRDEAEIHDPNRPMGGAVFSVKENRKRMEDVARLVDDAAMVVVSTEPLRRAIEEDYQRTKDVVVFPNSVRRFEFPMVDLAPSKELRVLWQGGSSHHEDLFEITEELGRVAARHPNVKFIFFGAKFSWIMAAIPEAQREHIEWVGFEEHRMKLATIPHDIALCPLRKNEFNDCKSAIKWYESSLRQKPAAVLASNWGPYRDEMEDGVTGLLYDTPGEFEQKLELLIADAELRARLGDAAQQWIWANRDASVTVPPLRDAMLERRARMLVDRRVFVERTVKECPALFKKG